MNRDEYLNKLKDLLRDIDNFDREEAIDYYRSYFEDAGAENENKVISTLGSPEKLAKIIKDGLNNEFDDYIEIGDEGVVNDKYDDKNEVLLTKNKEMNKKDKIIFIILILALCVPLSSVLNSLFGAVGILVSIILFFFGFWILTFVFYVIGAILIAAGVLQLFTYLGAGLIFIGIGLILIAMGELIGKIASWFFKDFIPKVINTCKTWVQSFIARRVES